MNLISWNVNGIRAAAKKNFFDFFKSSDADIFCIQETKAQDDQVTETLASIEGYYLYSNSAERKGYSGTAVLCKNKPSGISYGIGMNDHDLEGRVIALDFDKFYLVDVYVPNSGNELSRLNYRQTWDLDFFNYLKRLENSKPVIVCGDFNVAHKDIDLARPKENYNKSAGYTQTEIDGMDRFTGGGFIDTFRHFYPDKTEIYSWWSYRAGARQNNVGWRIDYFLASRNIMPAIQDAWISDHVMGSDHCPVGIRLIL